jgi:drug/metabolite transporter (DMT)-like permease
VVPLLLLFAVGSSIALTVALAKLAASAGVSGPEFGFWLSFGAGVLLTVAIWLSGKTVPLSRRHLAFYAVAGFLSLAAPNVTAFAIALVAGASYGIVPFALSPLITYPLAMAVGLDASEGRRFVGLLVGFAGTVLVLADIIMVTASSSLLWAVAALAIPLLVGGGNIYRTLYMPAGTSALELAAGVMLGSAAWLAPVFLFQGGSTLLVGFPDAALKIVLLQIVLSAAHYWLFMHLQIAGGPVYLSQIGYVAAAVGVVLAYFLFGALPTWSLLFGISMIAAGVILVRPRPHEAG